MKQSTQIIKERLDYAAFRKAHPAIRCYQQFTQETRCFLEYSKTGYKRRKAWGEFYYVHPMQPGITFGTAKAATTAAYQEYINGLEGGDDSQGH